MISSIVSEMSRVWTVCHDCY